MTESSLLFSLESLQQLENERIEREHAERQERRAHALRQERETRQREAELERQRIAAEQARQREEASRQAREQARLEAIRQGQIEQARAEVEAKARQTFQERQREHELAMATIRASHERHALRRWFALTLGVSVLAVTGLGWALVAKTRALSETQRQHATTTQEYRDTIKAYESQAAIRQRELDKVKAERRDLLVQQDEDTKRIGALEERLERNTKAPGSARSTPILVKPPRRRPKCDARNDPLCGL